MAATTAIWPAGTDESYRASAEPRLLDVPELRYLMIDGEGDPATARSYTEAVKSLYSVAYAARFDLKRAGMDAKVKPLEGMWWTDASGDVWASREAWRWTLMIAVPGALTDAVLERALGRGLTKAAGG